MGYMTHLLRLGLYQDKITQDTLCCVSSRIWFSISFDLNNTHFTFVLPFFILIPILVIWVLLSGLFFFIA